MNPKKKFELLVVKERSGELPLFNQLIKGFLIFTETLLFISVGAVVTAWEKIGKILKPDYDGRSNEPLEPSKLINSPSAEIIKVKIKVPLLPIDDYQLLTADQIIKRMKGLSQEQLETIWLFENAHRNRKSILEMIDRLRDRVEL
jgi:hypothetical protein